MGGKKWTESDDDYLRKYWLLKRTKDIAKFLNRSNGGIRMRSRQYLNLPAKKGMVATKPINIMSKEWKLYIAGLFDGDGCIGLYKRGGYPTLSITISTANEAFANKLKNVTGFSLYRHENDYNGCYQLTIKGKANAKSFLKQIYPYIILKKVQAKTVFDWMESKIELDDAINKLKIMKRSFNNE